MNIRLAPASPLRPPPGLAGAVSVMLRAQTADGAIPWFENGPWDPWNHAECVMALGVAGETAAAARGFDHLLERQSADGAWLGGYGNALPMQDRLNIARTPAPVLQDTNFIAYPAVAVWHALVLSGDLAAARRRWPMVRAAVDFVLARQHPAGDISWCAEAHGGAGDDALIAANAAIWASLGRALDLASALGEDRPDWRAARARLRAALIGRPDRFGRAGPCGPTFAMDWYYPVLAGVLTSEAAALRLRAGRRRFARAGLGCVCVEDQPWVTVAESCELTLALLRIGARAAAARLLAWQDAHRDADGAWWMGWQYEEAIVWPREQPTWTQAAAILAHDALFRGSAAHAVLISG